MIEAALVPLSKLKRLPRNPKDHDIGLIHESVDEFGFIERIIINKTTDHIIAGHGRIDVLQQLKASGKKPPEGVKQNGHDWHVPADYVEIPAAKEEKAAIALNRIPEVGGWKDDLLASVLSDFAAADDLKGTGYGKDDVDELLKTFSPASMQDQGKLDEKKKVKCPECGCEFAA